MGLFVVTTRANGGSEAIIPGENGIVLDEACSIQDLSQAIAAALQIVKDPRKPFAIRQSVQGFDFSRKLNELVSVVETTAVRPL